MLKKKLTKNSANKMETSPLWENVFKLECQLNEKLCRLQPQARLTHFYNPVEYAAQVHCAYLRKYLKDTKKLLFIGMNPEYDGMMQTGVPFGNISTVRDTMGLFGSVEKPPIFHPARPIVGFEYTREDPSGKHLWNLFQKVSNDSSLDTFFAQCFVHNFCPFAFYKNNGKNVTPNELKDTYKQQIRDTCLDTTEEIFKLIQPEIIVAVGNYVHDTLKKSEYCKNKRLLLLAHPSPRSVNNNYWQKRAENFLLKEDLIKCLRNEISTT